VVADGDLVDPQLPLGAFHGDLGLEAETVGADGNALQQVGAEGLVTGLHVGDVEVGEHVGNEREALVDFRVPEGQHAGLLAGQVAGAEYGVGVPVQKRPQQARVFRRVVLEVGVLDDGEISAGLLDGRAHGGAFALVHGMAEQPDGGVLGGQAGENIPSAVGRAVVDHYQLALEILGERRGQHLGGAALYHGAFVVDRHQDRELHGFPPV